MRSKRCSGGMRVLSVNRLPTSKLTITSSLMVVCQMSPTKWDKFLTWEGVFPGIGARISARFLAKEWLGHSRVKRGVVKCSKSRAEQCAMCPDINPN